MILLGIRTQAHVIDVCLHLSLAGNQFLHKGSASQDIQGYMHQLLKEGKGICGALMIYMFLYFLMNA